MCKGQVVRLMGPLCRAGSTLSLSLFLSVCLSLPLSLLDHSFGQSIVLSQSASPPFTAEPFPRRFDLALPRFLHLFPSGHLPASRFMSCRLSQLLSLPLSPPSLQQSVGEERTDLFKISKDRSSLVPPFLPTLPPLSD